MDGDFNLADGDVKGKFFKDSFNINGFKIDDFTFGVASETSEDFFGPEQGSLGLGLAKGDHPTILDAMFDAKLISSRTFSLYLDRQSSTGGNLLFGGHDPDKYDGKMFTFDSQQDDRWVISLTDMAIVPYKEDQTKKRMFKRQVEQSSEVSATDASTEVASDTATQVDSATDASTGETSDTATQVDSATDASTGEASTTSTPSREASATAISTTEASATAEFTAESTAESTAEPTGDNSDPDVDPESLKLDGVLTAVISSGYPLTRLPQNYVARMASYVGATLNEDSGVYLLSCATKVPKYLAFLIGGEDGIWIYVDFSELFIPLLDHQTFEPLKSDGEEICAFGLEPSDDRDVLLGMTFLRSAYVFFDVDQKKIGLAQAVWDKEESNVIEIPSGGSVEGASAVSGASITQSASVAKDEVGSKPMTSNATVGKPSSPAKSLEGGAKTTISGAEPPRGPKESKQGAPKSTGTSSAESSSKTSKAAAAGATFERSSLPLVGLSLCGSIMLIATLIL